MPARMLSDTQPSTNIPDLTGQVAYQTRVGVGAAASGAHGHVAPGTWTTAEGSKIKVAVKIIMRLHLLFGAAKGLEHLHSLNIIHGDLYPPNILINANGDACLTDFGLSVIFPEFCDTSYWSRTAGGAIRWRAPELLPPSSEDDLEIEAYVPVLTRHCDIYSFGSVALHVMSRKIPYHNIGCDARVILLMGLRKQPSRPPVPHLTEPYWRLVTYCWGDRGDPTSRPSIEEVLQAISTLQHIISSGDSA
ncbi:hypothetical protein HWV62_10871 [Athelia sp. TMB]|nr:hypothetical protein HWV62_10871 [Athelia sp. TMB]